MPTLFRCIGAPLFGIGKYTLAYRPPSLHFGALLSPKPYYNDRDSRLVSFPFNAKQGAEPLDHKGEGSVYLPILDRALCRIAL